MALKNKLGFWLVFDPHALVLFHLIANIILFIGFCDSSFFFTSLFYDQH